MTFTNLPETELEAMGVASLFSSPMEFTNITAGMHSESLDKAAKGVQSTYSNNPPVKFIDLEEARLSDWAKRKSQLIHAQQTAIRDAELTALFQTNSPAGRVFYEGALARSFWGETLRQRRCGASSRLGEAGCSRLNPVPFRFRLSGWTRLLYCGTVLAARGPVPRTRPEGTELGRA
jgi:hypothetical protein